ncbi:MAG: hypothetical protein ACRD1H_04120, partial [Vicinamibacterales bacterium]
MTTRRKPGQSQAPQPVSSDSPDGADRSSIAARGGVSDRVGRQAVRPDPPGTASAGAAANVKAPPKHVQALPASRFNTTHERDDRRNRQTTDVDSETVTEVDGRAGLDARRRGWFWHWNNVVTQYAPLLGLKGVGLLNSYTVWTDRRDESPHRGYAFPSQQSEADFYGEERAELITINKILVALDLIEIRKEMLTRTDERGRRWRVPHNLYRVKDRPSGVDLRAEDVMSVAELALMDATVFRYVRRVFSERFRPIDGDNVWHAILSEVRDHPTWRELQERTSAIEARASARTRAGHQSRTGATPSNDAPAARSMPNRDGDGDDHDDENNGDPDAALLPDTEQDGVSVRSVATSVATSNSGCHEGESIDVGGGNTGLAIAVAAANDGLAARPATTAAPTNDGRHPIVGHGNTTYDQPNLTTTTTTTSLSDRDASANDPGAVPVRRARQHDLLDAHAPAPDTFDRDAPAVSIGAVSVQRAELGNGRRSRSAAPLDSPASADAATLGDRGVGADRNRTGQGRTAPRPSETGVGDTLAVREVGDARGAAVGGGETSGADDRRGAADRRLVADDRTAGDRLAADREGSDDERRAAGARASGGDGEWRPPDAGGGGPLVDPGPLVISTFEAANDRRASPLERALLAELERDADPAARAAGATGAGWVVAAMREAVASGSTYVAPKRVREIVTRWAREPGHAPPLAPPTIGAVEDAPSVDREPVTDADVRLPGGASGNAVWAAVLADLTRLFERETYERLLSGSRVARYWRGTVEVRVGSDLAADKLSNEYHAL